jgi:hypothetical protein
MKALWTAIRTLSLISLGLIGACGGGNSPAKTAAAGCTNGAGLCITQCNLGCGPTGCGLTDIAVNQPLIFTFNQAIDKTTLNSETFQLQTSNGLKPVGSYFVQGNVVMFIPEVRSSGGKSQIGFKAQETYILTIPGRGKGLQTLESMSGDPLEQTFTCDLNVTKGVVDFDNRAPTARLITPTQLTEVPVDSIIVVEFSEIVDTSNLLLSAENNAVKFKIAKKAPNGNCASKDLPLPGTVQVAVDQVSQRTRLVFRPLANMPGGFCVRAIVTSEVRDLSGKRASPVTFEFSTKAGQLSDGSIVEEFDKPQDTRDALRDGAIWKDGKVVPGRVGGSGILGDFDILAAGKVFDPVGSYSKKIVIWNTDGTKIPGTHTRTGKDIVVTDGIYEFSSFVLDKNSHLRFIGSHPPMIKVSGKIEIKGTIDVSAPDGTFYEFNPKKSNRPVLGQKGSPGGPGASKGGQGGQVPFLSDPKSKVLGDIDGSDGQAIALPAGHPLKSLAGNTGGKGSKGWPQPTAAVKDLAGMTKLITFTAFDVICQQLGAGGGGGGFSTDGSGGKPIKNSSFAKPKTADFGPPSQGGTKVSLGPLFSSPLPSRKLFQMGGAGGGGAGYNVSGSLNNALKWSPGHGGAGGGGSLTLVAGGPIILQSTGLILAEGGGSQGIIRWENQAKQIPAIDSITGKVSLLDPPYEVSDFWNPLLGGAGSGGSVLFQSGGFLDLRGRVSVKGGVKRRISGSFIGIDSESGKGGAGFIRAESNPKPNFKSFVSFDPPAQPDNAGLLRNADQDKTSSVVTNWYFTKTLFPPTYLFYVIQAKVDGKLVTFSDNVSLGKRAQKGEPITLYLQGAQLDPKTLLPLPKSQSRWFEGVIDPLNTDGGNGIRFHMVMDRSATTTGQIEVLSLKVSFRG